MIHTRSLSWRTVEDGEVVRVIILSVVFRNLEIQERSAQVHLGYSTDWRADVVGRHLYMLCLGDGGDLIELRDASSVGDVGLQCVGRVCFNNLGERNLRVEPLTRSATEGERWVGCV